MSFAQGVEDLVDATGGKLSEGADGVQLLTIDYADDSIFLGDSYHWAGLWGSGMLDEAGGQVPVDDNIHLLGKDRVHPIGAGCDMGVVRWDGDL